MFKWLKKTLDKERELWVDYELNNDAYMTVDEDFLKDNELVYPALVSYLREHKIKDALITWGW